MSARRRLLALLALIAIAIAWPAGGEALAKPKPRKAPPEFVSLHDVAPSILLDIRYFTRHNFIGRRIHGYRAPMCILTRRAAKGLARVQAAVLAHGPHPQGLRLLPTAACRGRLRALGGPPERRADEA